MKFSYNWLKEYIKGRLPKPEKLAELLTLHSFEVESVTKRGGDFVLDIDVLPNRACDCLSHIGLARECAALTSSKFKVPPISSRVLDKVGKSSSDFIESPRQSREKFREERNLRVSKFLRVEVKDKKLCPRYTARVIIDVKIKDSPEWIKSRLLACGIKPINNIVDATNYIMLETGQPIHAFDLDKISGIQNQKFHPERSRRTKIKKIIIRRAKKRERITILDGEEYELDRDILVIADKKEPLAIAGIKGGRKAEIDGSTQTVVLESANFEPLAIRRASKKIRIKSDASRRFEAELDPNICEWALERVTTLIARISQGKQGKVARGLVDIYPKKVKPIKIKLDFKKIKDLLSVEISRQRLRDTFKYLGFKIKEHKFYLEVEIPTRRGDLSIPEDLIEEIVRIYGYNEICSQMPEVQLSIPKQDIGLFWENKIKDILVGAGFTEVYNYSFTNDADRTLISNADKTPIEIANPMNINQRYLRTSLVPNLLANIRQNLKYFQKFKIFELGKIYYREKKEIQERKSLVGAVVDDNLKNFYQAKGVVELLLNRLGIKKINFESYTLNLKPFLWHPSRTAEIRSGRKILGTVGEVHPEVLMKYDIDSRVALFELDFELLIGLANTCKIYKPLSRYPSITLDLAVIVNKHFLWENIKNRVLKEAGNSVKKVRLFDIYKGKGIPKGKISFAFHIVYEKENRTLTEREVKRVHEGIVRVLESMGGEVRR